MSEARQRYSLARHRLLRSDFVRIYRLGRRARGRSLVVVVHENALEHSRMGLSISKRHSKRAVDRNRMRRILREAFRLSRSDLPRGIDVVLIGALPGLVPSLEEARAELCELVARALKKKPRIRPETP